MAATSKFLRVLKIAGPHIGLTLFLLGFLLAGAVVFQALEQEKDAQILRRKATKIIDQYEQFATAAQALCPPTDASGRLRRKQAIYDALGTFSTYMEGRPFHVDAAKPDPSVVMPSRWSLSASTLYALSILTTTGYTYVMPMTKQGELFAVVYGLIGIPLMVLTAVDIGRFLSDCVLFVYSKVTPCCTGLLRGIGVFRHLVKRRSVGAAPPVHTRLVVAAAAAPGARRKPAGRPRPLPQARNLPLWVNASILLLFCTLGAFIYKSLGSERSFLEAFFITFNLVANLTMTDMPELSTFLAIFYIVFFVTFGLAVLSMCADLAAAELKWVFMKIHYFGRKIRWKRKPQEVNELLNIMDEIRRRYPEKEHISAADILEVTDFVAFTTAIHKPLQFIHEIGYPNLDERRETIAFMPGIHLKFADEMEDHQQLHR